MRGVEPRRGARPDGLLRRRGAVSFLVGVFPPPPRMICVSYFGVLALRGEFWWWCFLPLLE